MTLYNYRGFLKKATKKERIILSRSPKLGRNAVRANEKTISEFLNAQKKKTIAAETIEHHVIGLLGTDNVLPHSILLSQLLHWKAQELLNSETSHYHQLIENYLKNLRPAPCLAYSNLEIMPLFSD